MQSMQSEKIIKGNKYKVKIDSATGRFEVFLVFDLFQFRLTNIFGDDEKITAEFPIIGGTVENFPSLDSEKQSEFWGIFETALYKALEDDEIEEDTTREKHFNEPFGFGNNGAQ